VPTSTGCAEKTKLFEEVKAAMGAIITLNNLEMEAVMSGNLNDLEPLHTDLRRQRQIKDDLLYAYRTHVQSHGC